MVKFMQISLEIPSSAYFIRRYHAGEVIVNNTYYQRSVVVHGNTLMTDWPPQTFAELDRSHLQVLVDQKPEVILLGTGTQQRFPAPDLLQIFSRSGIGIEVMDTAAACRTYNLLAAEERNVLLAILLS